MTIQERILVFSRLFDELTYDNSRLGKERLIAEFNADYPELREDLTIILETLDNRHPIGWTFTPADTDIPWSDDDVETIAEAILFCKSAPDLSRHTTATIERILGKTLGEFIEPIVNRKLRLGIGKSLLVKDKLSPILAKKYEGGILRNEVFVTEKLDGNRCLAYYDGEWQYRSRNGKTLNVNFDMTGVPTDFVYDGEVMSRVQTAQSIRRNIFDDNLAKAFDAYDLGQFAGSAQFNETSGLINRKSGAPKALVYNVFDLVIDQPYSQRRHMLNRIERELRTNDVRIVPVMYTGTDHMHIATLLDHVVSMGGEGVMLNVHDRPYEHRRSDALLKYKQVQTMDMVVTGTFEGKGKYAGLCGGLSCYALLDDGREVRCEVGSGLSDAQREEWAFDDEIIGKIVEVAYHEMTQDRYAVGTKLYSLRFPRLKRVRTDKTLTSGY